MNTDFRVAVGFMRHPKTVELRARLGSVDPLLTLWAYLAEYRQDGNLGRVSPEAVARLAGWTGPPSQLKDALETPPDGFGYEHGFFRRDPKTGNLLAHDWKDHQPYVSGSNGWREAAKEMGRAGGKKSGAVRRGESDQQNVEALHEPLPHETAKRFEPPTSLPPSLPPEEKRASTCGPTKSAETVPAPQQTVSPALPTFRSGDGKTRTGPAPTGTASMASALRGKPSEPDPEANPTTPRGDWPADHVLTKADMDELRRRSKVARAREGPIAETKPDAPEPDRDTAREALRAIRRMARGDAPPPTRTMPGAEPVTIGREAEAERRRQLKALAEEVPTDA